MTGPVRAKGDDAVYIMPVHCPSFACWAGSVRPRMCAMEAGGRPIIEPLTAPKMMTKARAGARSVAKVQRRKRRREPMVVLMKWIFSAPKLGM